MIKYIKLQDEDIVSEVEETNDELILINPARIAITHQGVGLMKMNPFVKDKKITVAKKYVVYTATPDEEIVNGYNSQFGSGIVSAGKGILIG